MKKGTGLKIAAGLAALAGAYFIYKYFFPKKDKPAENVKETPEETPKPAPQVSGYPISKGSKGALVKRLQQYILQKDPKALPKFGADGDWGSETDAAVTKLYFGIVTIKNGKMYIEDEAQMNKIKAASKPVYKAGAPLVYQYEEQPSKPPFGQF